MPCPPDVHNDDTRITAAGDRNESRRLMEIYDRLLGCFGPQHWWPADTPFEVAVGAILTQNTNWKNVERAVTNLKRADALTVEGIDGLAETELAELIRPSGYFTVKARRLKNFIGYITEKYRGDFLASLDGDGTHKRAELLSVSGIGPETADSILLYAGGHPTFVVDAYTRRVMARHGLVSEGAGYDELRSLFLDNLPADAALFNEYHTLFVAVGKDYCRPKNPRCEECPLTKDPAI
ncbi:MAG: endonuclease III domain-containing protein [Deltaproteobacteria bacterium]|nr:endonuclease III domain-containing protein [Candidatus Zymogenaceae bacterium]